MPQIISIIGLILDLTGFVIIFYFGFFSNSQNKFLGKLNNMYLEIFQQKENAKTTINASKTINDSQIDTNYSKIAFILIILGFFFQLIGNVWQLLT